MNTKMWGMVVAAILAGVTLGWSTWISNATVTNRVGIAVINSEMKGICKSLDRHYIILEEIRDTQRRE